MASPAEATALAEDSGQPAPEPDSERVLDRAYTGVMTFRVVIEYDAEAKSYSAVCPELPGCASAGETELEARENIEEAIRLYLEPAEINLPESAKLIEVTVG